MRVAIVALLLAGCTPVYIDAGNPSAVPEIRPNRVVSETHGARPRCIAVGTLDGSPDAVAAVRSALYAHLAPRGRHPEFGSTNCDAVITGTVTEYGVVFLGIASKTAVGADLKMSAPDGAVIWAGHHTATRWAGGIPLDPVSAAVDVAAAVGNSSDEQMQSTTDDLARRLVSTMPVPAPGPQFAAPTMDPGADLYYRGALDLEAAGRTGDAVEALRRAGTIYVANKDYRGAARVVAAMKRIATAGEPK